MSTSDFLSRAGFYMQYFVFLCLFNTKAKKYFISQSVISLLLFIVFFFPEYQEAMGIKLHMTMDLIALVA